MINSISNSSCVFEARVFIFRVSAKIKRFNLTILQFLKYNGYSNNSLIIHKRRRMKAKFGSTIAQAEEARDKTPHDSFLSGLFDSQARFELAFPYPKQSEDDR